MAYVTLEDDTGAMELLCFSRVLETGGNYLREGMPVLVAGRLSARDEKEPQLVADTVRPLADLDPLEEPPAEAPRRLYLRFASRDARFRHLELVQEMFPGSGQVVCYFADTGQKVGGSAELHPAFVAEMREMLGPENVVLK